MMEVEIMSRCGFKFKSNHAIKFYFMSRACLELRFMFQFSVYSLVNQSKSAHVRVCRVEFRSLSCDRPGFYSIMFKDF